MTPEQAIKHFKTQSRLARALGKKQSSVNEWFTNGKIPDGAQYQIELATAGMLVADKPACRLDDFQEAVGLPPRAPPLAGA